MTIKKNGFLWKYAYKWSIEDWRSQYDSQVNLCKFFWICVFSTVQWVAAVMFAGILAMMLLMLFTNLWWAIIHYPHTVLNCFLLATGVAAALIGWFWYDDTIANTEVYQLTREFIAAKKSKVCPIIDIKED